MNEQNDINTPRSIAVKTLGEVEKILASHKEELCRKYSIVEIGIFGSFARGDQTEKSDVDIPVGDGSPVPARRGKNARRQYDDREHTGVLPYEMGQTGMSVLPN